MKSKTKKKNAHAVSLGKRSGIHMTREQRVERAKKARAAVGKGGAK